MLITGSRVWEWLTGITSFRSFSVQTYITDCLLDWLAALIPQHLIDATRFIAANYSKLNQEARQQVVSRIPWLLANGQVWFPGRHDGKELVTPAALENDTGWTWVFVGQIDRRHFWVIADVYVENQSEGLREALRKLMEECGATSLPDPAEIDSVSGIIDYGAPSWLDQLNWDHPRQNVEQRIKALECWIKAFKRDYFTKFLRPIYDPISDRRSGCSTLERILRDRPWLATSQGFSSPSEAFLDTPEIRQFLGDSVPYVKTTLPAELLEELGVNSTLTADTLLGLLRNMRIHGAANEDLIVRIYHRLRGIAFNPESFRKEKLVYLTHPATLWMSTDYIVWEDAGDVFDDEFGYAALTYGNEDLHGFFAQMLGVPDEPTPRNFAEVWRRMSMSDQAEPKIVEKRLTQIFPKLAALGLQPTPPDWWETIRSSLKVWTTAQRFERPGQAFAPDNSFAETLFSSSAPIAWTPKTQNARSLQFLQTLGCRSLEKSLRSSLADVTAPMLLDTPAILTEASKELLFSWVCGKGNWTNKQRQLEILICSEEVEVTELVVNYQLHGFSLPSVKHSPDAFWSLEERKMYILRGATTKAKEAAVALAVARHFEEDGKSEEDLIRCLLGHTPADASREAEKRKWLLTPSQKEWFQGLGGKLSFLEVETQIPVRSARKPRAGVATPQAPVPTVSHIDGGAHPHPPSKSQDNLNGDGFALPSLAAANEAVPIGDEDSDEQERELLKPDDHTKMVSGLRSPSSIEISPSSAHMPKENDGNDKPMTRLLKSTDADCMFINVAAHQRSRPQQTRQSGTTQGGQAQSGNSLAQMAQVTKAQLEDLGVEFSKRKLQQQGFNITDRRKENLGYDLFAAKPGHVLRIEIKSHAGEAKSVFVTKREWDESKDRSRRAADDRWELWNVENLAADAGTATITVYRQLPDNARVSGYWVDLTQCGRV